MKFTLTVFLSVLLLAPFASAQKKEATWDNTTNKNRGSDFKLVQVKSFVDHVLQNAWYHQSKKLSPQPLIVSLHTCSGDYNRPSLNWPV